MLKLASHIKGENLRTLLVAVGIITLLFTRAHAIGLTISGSTLTINNGASLTVSTMTINSGAVFLNNATLNAVLGDIVLNGGSMFCNVAQILLGGNWTNMGGNFTPGTSTVKFTGASPTLTGSTTFYNLTYSQQSGPVTMTFASGSTQTVQGVLTLQGGGSSSLITLAPSNTNQPEWYLDNSGTNSVGYVSVSYSNALAGHSINASGSVDNGSNYNWIFGAQPGRPGGLNVTIPPNQIANNPEATTTNINLNWNTVLYDVNGNTLSSPPKYMVMISNTIPTDGTDFINTPNSANTTFINVSTSTTWPITLTNGQPTYVAVKAIEGGAQSGLSMIFHWPIQTLFSPSTDPVCRYELTPQANTNLYTSADGTRRNWVMLLKELGDLSSDIVKSIEVYVVNADNNQPVNDYFDSTGGGTLYFGYTVQAGNIMQGSAAFPRNTVVAPASQASNALSLFWESGNNWIKCGAPVDTSNNQITYQTGRGGNYQIRAVSQSGNLSLVQVYPRIITPNVPGYNVAIFQFGEGSLTGSGVTGEMFNIRGVKVADLQPGPDPTSSLEWNGQTNEGQTVPAGIYIYQIKSSGSRTSGTIVVAR